MRTTPASSYQRLARIGTEVLAPWVWVLGLPLVVAWSATGRQVGQTLLWGLLVGVTGSVIPMAVIVRGARKGKWDGHHVTNREGRLIPFLVCMASLAVGFLLLIFGHAPHEMIALAASMLCSLVGSIAITTGLKWKISIHAAVAAGAVVILAIVYGPWWLLLAALAAWVSWSRVALGDHTTGQVLAGNILGLITGGFGYWVLELALS